MTDIHNQLFTAEPNRDALISDVPEKIYPNYSEYRRRCDQSNLVCRKQGILSEAGYCHALADEDTLVHNVSDLFSTPICIPIKYVTGISQEYFDAHHFGKVYYISPMLLDENQYDVFAEIIAKKITFENAAAFYEYSNEFDYGAKKFAELVFEKCRYFGGIFSIDLMEDENIPAKHEEARPAAMTFFNGEITHISEGIDYFDGRSIQSGKPLIYQLYQAAVTGGDLVSSEHSGVSAYCAEELLGDRQDLLESMWKIYKDRFQELGEHFPISLEDSYEDFVEMISNKGTTTLIAYSEGQIACFTFLVDNFSSTYWLNGQAIESIFMGNDNPTFYFPGIVAHRERGGMAYELLYAFGGIIKFGKLNCNIFYECTNHSTLYIPTMIEKAAEHSRLAHVKNRLLDTISYRIIVPCEPRS